MEKVKIFTYGTSDTFDELETTVNDWLAKHSEKIKVVSRQITSAAGINIEGKSFVNCTIAIFYQ